MTRRSKMFEEFTPDSQNQAVSRGLQLSISGSQSAKPIEQGFKHYKWTLLFWRRTSHSSLPYLSKYETQAVLQLKYEDCEMKRAMSIAMKWSVSDFRTEMTVLVSLEQ
jgi:hypothetical protein